jgi:uncharacterized protein (TIGR00251 family)
MIFIRENPHGIIFKVFVQPRSSKNMIASLHGDALKIKLTAPPVDNAANNTCIKYLAKCLGVPTTSLQILTGHKSRMKQILLQSDLSVITPEEYQRLRHLIAKLIAP